MQPYATVERSRYDSVGSSTSTSGDEPNGTALNRRGSIKKKKFMQLIDGLRPSENLMNESNVFGNDDGKTWDWEIITTIFTKVSVKTVGGLGLLFFIISDVILYKFSISDEPKQQNGHTTCEISATPGAFFQAE